MMHGFLSFEPRKGIQEMSCWRQGVGVVVRSKKSLVGVLESVWRSGSSNTAFELVLETESESLHTKE